MVAWRNRSTLSRVAGGVLACACIGLGVTACGGTAGAASAVSSSMPAPSSGAPAKDRHDGVAGKITAENGSSWIVTTKAGKQMTVDITSDTKFGTTDHPATEQQFTVGATVRVTGPVTGTTVSASRIAVPQARPNPSASATPTPTA